MFFLLRELCVKKFFLVIGTFAACGATSLPARADTVLAPRGTVVFGTLLQTLSSKSNKNGDTFAMSQKNTWFHHSEALTGATIDGHVENVTPAGPTHKATMSIIFDDVKLADGTLVPLQAKATNLKPPTHHVRDTGLIMGSAVAGHMLGSRAHVKHGAMAGAAAGFAIATTMKSDIVVKTGTRVEMKLSADLVKPG
jgi:hypothetical protein